MGSVLLLVLTMYNQCCAYGLLHGIQTESAYMTRYWSTLSLPVAHQLGSQASAVHTPHTTVTSPQITATSPSSAAWLRSRLPVRSLLSQDYMLLVFCLAEPFANADMPAPSLACASLCVSYAFAFLMYPCAAIWMFHSGLPD